MLCNLKYIQFLFVNYSSIKLEKEREDKRGFTQEGHIHPAEVQEKEPKTCKE